MGELEVLVDGRSVYSYKRSSKAEGRKPTVPELLSMMKLAA
jgi:hypothetical protein